MGTDPATASRPAARTIVYWAIGLLLWSLTFIQRSNEGWNAGSEFHVSAERVAAGLPLPWIGWTTLAVTGNAPPLEELPDGREWKPGVYFDAPRFVLVPAVTLALAAVIVFTASWCRARMRRQGVMPTRSSVIAVGLGAAGIGALVPTNPFWIGMGLGVALIVGIVAATWNRARAITVVFFIVLAMLTIWWVQRIASHFWTRYKPIQGYSLREDLVAPVTLAMCAFLVVMGVHLARRLVVRARTRAVT